MPRNFSPAMVAALSQKVVPLALFCSIAFANEIVYVFSGVGQLTPAGPAADPLSTFPYGQTFVGAGEFGRISTIPQSKQVIAQNITIGLSGIPSQLLLDSIGQVRLSGTATVWLGFFDSNGALIADPIQLFLGSLDVPTVTDDSNTCDIAITCENPLIGLNLAPNHQFDDADQQIRHPGDLGFSFVDNLQNLQLFWPAPDKVASPYPLTLTITPNGHDLLVGGTQQMTVTINYSNGTSYSHSSTSGGSGPAFQVILASSNPRIATVDPITGIVKGVSPGVCSIIARVPVFDTGSGAPISANRAACSVIVRTL